MAAQRLQAEEWTPPRRTRIITGLSPVREARDERAWIAKPTINRRPTPLDIQLAQPRASYKTSPKTGSDFETETETVCNPEIVDFAKPKAWERRSNPSPLMIRRSDLRKRGSPSVVLRQSKMSFGILDYYMNGPSPVPSPDLPSAPTPVDLAIEKFDFRLTTQTSNVVDTKAGADADLELEPLSPRPIPDTKTQYQHRKVYSLFPTVQQRSPASSHRLAQVINSSPVRTPAEEIPEAQIDASWRRSILANARMDTTPARSRAQVINTPSPTTSVAQNITPKIPHHQPPDASYRPRKESLSDSIVSRKDSVFCQAPFQRGSNIPMPILSSSTISARGSSASTSTAQTLDSPLNFSRWSDDTITRPTAATIPGPRNSFGSLLGACRESDSAQYWPACFFEDEDEDAPLRRKLRWMGRGSWEEGKARRKSRGRFEQRRAWWRVLLCCGA